jgi:hypothetical protein
MVAPRKVTGGWQARYHHPDDARGTYRSAGVFGLKTDASDEARKVEESLRRGEYVSPKDGLETFASYAATFIAEELYGEEATRGA